MASPDSFIYGGLSGDFYYCPRGAVYAAGRDLSANENVHEINNGPGDFTGPILTEGNKMDACKKIQFYTPAQTGGYIAGILATGAALLALVILC